MGLISRVSSRTYGFPYKMADIQTARVECYVTSTTKGFKSLQNLDRSLSIMDLKCKFELVVGLPVSSQELTLFDTKENKVCSLSDNDRLLGSYPIEEAFRIHVTSAAGSLSHNLDFNDVSKVEKYEMEEDKYDQMKGTVRDFKRKMKMGRFDTETVQAEQERKLKE